MNHYLLRKKLFALLFLLIIPAFSLWNFLSVLESLAEEARVKFLQVSQGTYTAQQAITGMENTISENFQYRMNFVEG